MKEKMKSKNNAIAITAIVSGVILIVALVALFSFKAPNSTYSGNTVNVEGIATVNAMPDVISVYFNIETEGNTSSEAKDKNSEILNDLLIALILEGFDRDEIITENFNIYPNYEWTEDGREDNGFKATHSVKVVINSEESDDLGNIVDAGVDAGAGINYINFELSQELQNQYKAEAMKLAAKDAQIKADSVAEGFGLKTGKLVSVQVSDFGYYPWNVYSSSGRGVMEDAGMAKEAASNIQPGEKEVTARISATFKLR